LWVRKIFARISPNLLENASDKFCANSVPHTDHEDLFGMISKKKSLKDLHVILQTLGAMF